MSQKIITVSVVTLFVALLLSPFVAMGIIIFNMRAENVRMEAETAHLQNKRIRFETFTDRNFRLVVDYDLPLSEAMRADNFEDISKHITKEFFPRSQEEVGVKELQFILYHFDREIKPEEAIRELKKEGYRPATLRELLCFVCFEEDHIRALEWPLMVAALGSIGKVTDKDRFVPCLIWSSKSELHLGIYEYNEVLNDGHRFLAVKE